ncbi:hypothetical protein H8356DRAFT_1419882 [Neocallimastix lanati (nom. inval.)]|nr:hypothetical protein H8356DRAFT_1419882 [Neocallimastix sp. JGI-2020a]
MKYILFRKLGNYEYKLKSNNGFLLNIENHNTIKCDSIDNLKSENEFNRNIENYNSKDDEITESANYYHNHKPFRKYKFLIEFTNHKILIKYHEMFKMDYEIQYNSMKSELLEINIHKISGSTRGYLLNLYGVIFILPGWYFVHLYKVILLLGYIIASALISERKLVPSYKAAYMECFSYYPCLKKCPPIYYGNEFIESLIRLRKRLEATIMPYR